MVVGWSKLHTTQEQLAGINSRPGEESSAYVKYVCRGWDNIGLERVRADDRLLRVDLNDGAKYWIVNTITGSRDAFT